MTEKGNTTENLKKENQGAHSGFRKGMSDYNDGGNTNHYLGNDDYKEGNFITDSFNSGSEKKSTSGQVAYGNEVEEDEEGTEHTELEPPTPEQ